MSRPVYVDHEARAEDVRWMVATGENLTGAARRLGLTPDGLTKWAERHGYAGEIATLRRRDPICRWTERGRDGAHARWAS